VIFKGQAAPMCGTLFDHGWDVAVALAQSAPQRSLFYGGAWYDPTS
jgi:hypothetical protein